ncbi:MAG: AAA family ATPase, partial [Elusimicrobiales bacterium]|nr:AAA family ATPase [Elusimicrobiales bacterium]
DEREQTLNQLLVELDGFEGNENVILIAATNRPDVLDPALLRPGRFDRRINVPSPDSKGREEILQVHAKKIKLAPDIDLSIIARRTPGFVGADLANIINESAIFAARKDKKFVEMEDIEESIERVIAGPQRKSRIISDKERRVIAFHEAGHALVAKILPHTDPVHKISIAPRGPALGYTLQLPIEDKYLTTKTEIVNKLSILLGGRAAEEIEFNEITTGAQDDLSKVTNYARKMVLEFGMSEKIGLITLRKDEDEVFLGRDIAKQPGYSNEMAKNVDDEIKRIVSECYVKAKEMLTDERHLLNSLAEKLLEKEILESDEIDLIVNGNAAA